MTQPHYDLARAFFRALETGDVPDDILTDDMSVWTSGGSISKAPFQGAMKLYASIFSDGPHYTVDSLTAQDDRVAAEVRSDGTLVNGETFHNDHVYVFRIRDGRIAHMAEHMNELVTRDQIGPLMHAAMSKASA